MNAPESGQPAAGDGELVAIDVPQELQSPSVMTSAIYSAIDAQRSVAVAFVRGVRARQMKATPAEIITSLERRYVASVTASGTAVGATAFIPGAGTAVALGAGTAELLLQFELAALFGLAVAEVHGLRITDRDRVRVVILSLMLGPEGRSKVAGLAKAAVLKDASAVGGAAGRSRELGQVSSLDQLPFGDLLGSAVPSDMMPAILDTVQGLAKKELPEKVAIAGTRLVPGGIGMVLGGIGGFSAGSEVVQAARQAFGPAPEELPDWLEPIDSDGDGIPDPSALETGMRSALGSFVQVSGSAGKGIANAAKVVGGGVATAATSVSNQFRSVDLDGDGIPDEARALSAVKGAGRFAAGAAGNAKNAAASFLSARKRSKGEPEEVAPGD